MPQALPTPTQHATAAGRPTSAGVGVAALLTLALCLSAARPAAAAAAVDLAAAQKQFQAGDYAGCVAACQQGIEDNRWLEAWWLLKIRAEVATGQYPAALTTYEAAVERHAFSLPLRWAGVEVLRANGRDDDARAALGTLRATAERAPRRLEDAASRVAVGRAFLQDGGDARQILETYFDRAKKDDPTSPLPHLAAGELALAKHDLALAADAYKEAVKRAPDDPDAHLGLARAFADDSAERSAAALAVALKLNPRHADSLLFRADAAIDREDYKSAEADLAAALAVNPKHAVAWAYRAVLAHLAGKGGEEKAARDAALSTWATNPGIDHLIGRKLSAKYRFAEGEAYQRRALQIAPTYRPANVQLCQDLLRLGKENEGWRRAGEAFDADPYDVVAYNLVTLRDNLASFRVLKDDAFVVRMDPREADVYGPRVLRLLAKARQTLAARYGAEIAGPVTVEIFPKPSDFAIRTFGLPGGAGFLGVCFGPVITVNSPASRMAHPSSWEAVLWHEFCHTVTLAKTNNKMPRWLSEGISVYEERRENPAWGQSMNPRYRELILAGGDRGGAGGKAGDQKGDAFPTPVSKLSGAFLRPPSPMHLQFAYYESSMVVEYVAGRFGSEAIARVLTDLAADVPINDALARHTEPIDKLDVSFAEWLRGQAEAMGPPAAWEKPDLALDADAAAMAAWNKDHPGNFWGQLGEGRALLAERKFREAEAPLVRAAALWPACGEPGGPYLLLAAVRRELGDVAGERAMLAKHVALDADAVEPRLRLAEAAAAAGDWPAVRRAAEQAVAVNPLLPTSHQWLAKAAEATSDRQAAVAAHRTLLLLDPLSAAGHRYQLAKLLAADDQLAAARREVVLALEEAPRYREAYRLLTEIAGRMDRPATGPTTRSAGRAGPRPGVPAK
jgi:tetratricopeptide (TPR) repeat protein